jgi:hypothetical protein
MAPDEVDFPNGFALRSRMARASISLTSLLAVLLAVMLCTGHINIFGQIFTMIGHLIMGACAPLSTGKEYILKFFQVLQSNTIASSIGKMGIINVAMCCLPIPGQNIVNAALELLASSQSRSKIIERAGIGGAIVGIPFSGSWLIALTAGVMEKVSGHEPGRWLAIATAVVSAILLILCSTKSAKEKGSEFET